MSDDWQPIETAPRDGSTIELRATLIVHHLKGVKFPTLPRHWRPDTPQTEWWLTHWRPHVSVTGCVDADGRGRPGNVAST